MNILLIFISPGKTTEKISKILAAQFEAKGHKVTSLNIGKSGYRSFQEVGVEPFKDVNLIGIGSPVIHLRVMHQLTDFIKQALPVINPKARAFLYLAYGGISSGKAFLDLTKLLQRFHIPIIGAFKVWAPHFFTRMDYPDTEALTTIDNFCSSLEISQYQPIDPKRVDRIFSYQTWKVRIAYHLAGIIGKLRELPIRFDEEKCHGCKRCVNECPTGALTMQKIPVRSSSKCAYCYHCAVVCPQNAVICPTEKVKDMVRTNKKIIGCEQPQNAVYI